MILQYMSLVMRKPAFCICENKDADQLRGNPEADQRLCFRYTDRQSLYFLNLKFQESRHILWMYSLVCVGLGQKPRRPVFSQRGSYLSVHKGLLKKQLWKKNTHTHTKNHKNKMPLVKQQLIPFFTFFF